MKFRHGFAAALLALSTIGTAYAAGGPLNENFTDLIALTTKAAEAGKAGDAAAFQQSSEEALKLAKEQNITGNSVILQRVTSRLRTAINASKAGKMPEGTQAVDEAIAEMKKVRSGPKFGGGSE